MKNANQTLVLAVVALVVLYAFMYQPKQRKEGYCGACQK